MSRTPIAKLQLVTLVLFIVSFMCVATSIAGSISYKYDEQDRMYEVTLENSQKITYEYDKIGNMKSRTVSQDNSTGPGPFTISVTLSGCGTVSPAGSLFSLDKGSSKIFNFQENAGSYLADVQVDGASIGIVSSYTFHNITANHTLSVRFIIPDGDANNDGSVDIADALLVLRASVYLTPVTPQILARADVAPLDANGNPAPDGQITIADATVILRKVVGLINLNSVCGSASKTSAKMLSSAVNNTSTVSLIPSGNGSYTIQGTNMDGVAGIQLTIAYDTTTLGSPSVTLGSLVSGAMLVANTTTNPGFITIGIMTTSTFSGNGPIAVINFATWNGASAVPTLIKYDLSDTNGRLVSTSLAMAPPPAPTGISAIAGNAQVIILWTAGTGSTSSSIRYGTTSGNYTTTIDPAVSPQTISNLNNGTPIYYQVGAKNGAGTTWSSENIITPIPAAVTGISAMAGNSQAIILWTPGAGSPSSSIRYGTTSGNYTTTIDPAVSPQTISNLNNGTPIYYQIGAKNGASTTWSPENSVTPLVSLTTMTLTTPGSYTYYVPNRAASLTINAKGAGGGGGGGGDWDCNYGTAGTTGGSTTVLYQFVTRVNAYGGFGGSPGGDDASIAAGGAGGTGTGTLFGQTVALGTNGGEITGGAPNGGYGGWGASNGWGWNSGNGGGGGSGGQVSGTLSVTPGTVVTIVVGAGGSGGLGAVLSQGPYGEDGMHGGSGSVTITEISVPSASAPTGLSATAGNAQAIISWTAGTNSTSSIIRYGSTSGNYTTTIDPAVSPQTIYNLTNGTPIYYQVGAKIGSSSIWSLENSVTPMPSTPTVLSATAGNAQAIISWTAGAGSTSSNIRYGSTSGNYTNIIDPAVSPQTISNLYNGSAIYYQVGAKSGASTTWSSENSITPIPAAATGISAMAGNAQAIILWTPGAGSTSSSIRYGTTSGNYTATIDPAVSPQTLTNLNNGMPIYYQVGSKSGTVTIWSQENSVTPVAIMTTRSWTTSGTYTFTIPNGVTSLNINAKGAGGGGGGGGDWDCNYGTFGSTGGSTTIQYQSVIRASANGGFGGSPGGDDASVAAGGAGGTGTGTLSGQTVAPGSGGGEITGGAPNGGYGGWGASDGWGWNSGNGGGGGSGGLVSGTLSVTPGTVVTIMVGAGGPGGSGANLSSGPYGDDGMPGGGGSVTIIYAQ
jgi:YD repeat-containing protein